MSGRHRAFREPTLDSSKANVRFSFQGPRPPTCCNQNLSVGCVGVANHSRRVWPVNYFLSDREEFRLLGDFRSLFRDSSSRAGSAARFLRNSRLVRLLSQLAERDPLVLEPSGLRYPISNPPGGFVQTAGAGPNVEPVVVGPLSSVKDEPAFFSPNSTA